MRFHVLTLFPEMIINGLNTSITGRAIKNEKIELQAVDIRDFSEDKHKKADDYIYGGGAGLLMQPEPVYRAFESVRAGIKNKTGKLRCIYVTPQGRVFDQDMAREFSKEEDLVFLCGHYEGIDERVLEEIVTDYVSIGDYVLTGGELPAMVMIDCISRLVPGVLHNENSAVEESFHGMLLEHPQYTRPEIWHGKAVPVELLSGNPKIIRPYQRQAQIERTKRRRPDLFEKYCRLEEARDRLIKADKHLYIDMTEHIKRGSCELVYMDEDQILLQDKNCSVTYHAALSAGGPARAIADLSEYLKKADKILFHQREEAMKYEKLLKLTLQGEFYQSIYTRKEKLPISGLYRLDGLPEERGPAKGMYIRQLTEGDLEKVFKKFSLYDETYVRAVQGTGQLYGAYVRDEGCEMDELVAMAGKHLDGSCGMLEILKKDGFRHAVAAKALFTYMVNTDLEAGRIPYGQYEAENGIAKRLHDHFKLVYSKKPVYWARRGD